MLIEYKQPCKCMADVTVKHERQLFAIDTLKARKVVLLFNAFPICDKCGKKWKQTKVIIKGRRSDVNKDN